MGLMYNIRSTVNPLDGQQYGPNSLGPYANTPPYLGGVFALVYGKGYNSTLWGSSSSSQAF
jgi:hypothetical protein